ncbi:4Fe-4S dicluster domain-containing protein [bacterium]|nr:4Fe-4S dicluster domain-containing protein [bacterium]
MNPNNLPVFTKFAECQDCYKCVRGCPVKAIKVENHHASIIPELCIHCGHCVDICPVNTKCVRDDLGKLRLLVSKKQKIVISLAPSWKSEFPNLAKEKMIAGLKLLGISEVSETALGAEEVNSNLSIYLKVASGVKISTACPTVVELVEKYFPQLVTCLIPFDSPLLAHSKILKAYFGENYNIGFIGPCISKKIESDNHQELLDFAITFKDLHRFFAESKIDPYKLDADSNKDFLPQSAKEGSLYPVEGGMIDTMLIDKDTDYQCFAISGTDDICKLFTDLVKRGVDKNIFLETLSCKGGCINGPACIKEKSYLLKEIDIINNNEFVGIKTERKPALDICQDYNYIAISNPVQKEISITEVFRKIGKFRPEDEKNCGGCGYNTCREFAQAIIDGKAEASMCVSYLRKLAQKKANALFRTMPSGVIIVDKDMIIQETNVNFFKILGLEDQFATDAIDLDGARLDRMISFTGMFKKVLDEGNDILDKELRYGEKYFKISIFSIEKHELVGAVLQDITLPSVARGHTISQAKAVINKNLDMVQKIAFLLGENAAEVEIALNSIIDVSGIDKTENISE